MAGLRFLVYQGRLTALDAHAWLRGRIGPGQIAMAVDPMKAMEGAVLMGAGIGLLPRPFGGGNPSVIQCLALPPEAAFALWFVVNPAAYCRPEVKAFAAFFVPRYRALFRES